MGRYFILLGLICMILAACGASPPSQATVTTRAPTLTVEFSTPAPTITPMATIPPTFTAVPTQPLPAPAAFFDLYIDNLVISPRGALSASGFKAGDDLRYFAQWGSEGWSELGGGFRTAGNSLAVDSAGNLYTEILTDTVNCMEIVQWDGNAWKNITGDFASVVDALQAGRISCNAPVQTLASVGDTLYVAGSYYYPNADFSQELAMGYVAAWNDGSWSVVGQGVEAVNIYAMAADAAGNVYIAGEQPAKPESGNPVDGYVAQWDGTQWAQLGTSMLDSCTTITHMTSDDAGGLYISCMLNGPGELISYWNGTDWTALTDRLDGEAPAIFDMAADMNGKLCIAGDFEAVSGVSVLDIACWDGSGWQALGDGVNGRVQALVFDPGGMLNAAGWFTEAGGQLVDHIASWDGTTWQALTP